MHIVLVKLYINYHHCTSAIREGLVHVCGICHREQHIQIERALNRNEVTKAHLQDADTLDGSELDH